MRIVIPHKSTPIESSPTPLAVSVKEAAHLLGVCQRTVWQAAKRGDIQSRKIGSRVVFPLASINQFLHGTGEAIEE